MKKTKIVCTMGPSCQSVETLQKMIRAGMDVARLNMAHGTQEQHREFVSYIREAADREDAPIPIMMDIKGPEIRIGELSAPSFEIAEGSELTLTTWPIVGDDKRISVSYKELVDDVRSGSRILIDDGLIELTVLETSGTEVRCKVANTGLLKPRKGVNLPGVHTSLPGVTDRDREHIRFGISLDIDILAVSFVRKGDDIREIRQFLKDNGGSHIQIISKIENEEGLLNLEDILAASDGLMVARGDLGVEIPAEEVPIAQKAMIRRCNQLGKPVITATQMLDSMQIHPRPTRAEATDVANAVLDGSDAIMLSGESASGKYPVDAVSTMARIAMRAEAELCSRVSAVKPHRDVTEVVSHSVVTVAESLEAKAIITPTATGLTARMVARHRPSAPILAITPDDRVRRRLNLFWGVLPLMGDSYKGVDDMLASAIGKAIATGIVSKGDLVVISSGTPVSKSGSTNLIKVQIA